MPNPELYWLPLVESWLSDIKAIEAAPQTEASWDALKALAGARVDFLQTMRINRQL
jgi:hypothetical protein